jgi:DNA-binding response OmpR family regulator
VFVAFLAHDARVATSIPLPAREARPTILVVDDEPSTQRMLDRLLAFHQFAPRQASNIQDATIIAEREPVDAFVVDLTLGREESGMDMVAWLRQHRGYAMAPVFVLTSHLDIPDSDQTLISQHGAHLFYKGQSLELLIDRLQQILTDSAHLR